jgi:serine protease Do
MMFRLFILLTAVWAGASAQEDPSAIYSSARKSVVLIKGAHKQGSGFIIHTWRCSVIATNCTPHALLITNYHVIAGESAVTLMFENGHEITIESVIAADPKLDLALIPLSGENLDALDLNFAGKLAVGEKVFAIGNPLGLEGTMSDGLVSGFRESRAGVQMILFSAPISPGSSGGPLIDKTGNVIGIVTATFEGGQNLNLALPTSAFREFARNVVSEAAANQQKLPHVSLASLAPEGDEAVMAVLRRLGTYVDKEMNAEAERTLRNAIEQDEFNSVLRLELAKLLIRTRRFDQAQSELRVVLRLDPHEWPAATTPFIMTDGSGPPQREPHEWPALAALALTADLKLKEWLITASASDRNEAFRIYSDLMSKDDVAVFLNAAKKDTDAFLDAFQNCWSEPVFWITLDHNSGWCSGMMINMSGWPTVLKTLADPEGEWTDGKRTFSMSHTSWGQASSAIRLIPRDTIPPWDGSTSLSAYGERYLNQTAYSLPREEIILEPSAVPGFYSAVTSDFDDAYCGYKESA